MKRTFNKILSTALVLSVSSIASITWAQVITPANDPGIEIHVKGYLQVVNAATPIPVSEMPVEQARQTYAYATT
ncbi:hypothetical protein GCM10028818_61460 [Spirosoma horti]